MTAVTPDSSWNDDGRDPGPVVRPYAMTGGRTRSIRDEELELETLVSTTAEGEMQAPSLDLEQRSIALLCRDLLSVAEISARLDVPLGVARVLIGDMAEGRLLAVHPPHRSDDDRPDLALLERVLYGLRAI
jgi:Protein of unknown function (DUF742)